MRWTKVTKQNKQHVCINMYVYISIFGSEYVYLHIQSAVTRKRDFNMMSSHTNGRNTHQNNKPLAGKIDIKKGNVSRLQAKVRKRSL